MGALGPAADAVRPGVPCARVRPCTRARRTRSWCGRPAYGAGYPFGESAGRLRDLSPIDVAKAGHERRRAAHRRRRPVRAVLAGRRRRSTGSGCRCSRSARATRPRPPGAPCRSRERVTRSGEVEARFDEDWGYDQPQSGTFYDRFAVGRRPSDAARHRRPVRPRAAAATPSSQVKRSWWRQVLAAVQDRPLIRGMTVLEAERREPEAGNRVADWRLTADPGVAESFRTDLERSGRLRLRSGHRPRDRAAGQRRDLPGVRRPAATRWRGSSGWPPAWRSCSC